MKSQQSLQFPNLKGYKINPEAGILENNNMKHILLPLRPLFDSVLSK